MEVSEESENYHDYYDRETIKQGRLITDPVEREKYKYERWKGRPLFIEDRKRNNRLWTKTQALRLNISVECRRCGRELMPSIIILLNKEPLFILRCPIGHLPKRSIYQDGREYFSSDSVQDINLTSEPESPIDEADRDLFCFSDEQARASTPAWWEEMKKDIEELASILKEAQQILTVEEIKERITEAQ